MSKALVPVTKESWDVIQSVAPVVQASRMFGVTEEQAAVTMLKGHELGLGLASSFEYIHVIDSKPSLAPKGALALIQQSGELAGLKIDEGVDSKGAPNECSVWMKRTNGFEYTATFTMADAARAGLVKKGGGWDKYPANMLRWRAIGYCADIVFPDVTGGMYRPEELGAEVDEDGVPIEGTWKVEPSETAIAVDNDTITVDEGPTTTATAEADEEAQATLTLNALIAEFGAKAILAANNDQIPQTDEELALTAAKLDSLQREEEAAGEVEEEPTPS